MSQSYWIDELERDLGQAARLTLLANAGGQRRQIPTRRFAPKSKLAQELGVEIVVWLAERFGQTAIDIPSLRGSEARDRSALLRAAILEAGLIEPSRSANEIAIEFQVTAKWVHVLRAQMREDAGIGGNQMSFPFDTP